MRSSSVWDMLEVRHLRAFTEVVRLGSFGAAARELGYTQSGVSQQVQGLERIVGVPLLHRPPGGRRPVEPTDAGRLLLEHARPLLARVEATRADLESLALGERGRVRVATIQSIGARILPGALRAFRAVYPAADVQILRAATPDDLLDAVADGSVDVGFTVLPVPTSLIDVRGLGLDPFVLVTPAGAPERTLADLPGRRVLGLRGCMLEQLVEAELRAAGVAAPPDLYDDNGMVQELVAAGEGVAVVPRLTVDLADGRVATHEIPELPPRRLAAVAHRERRLGPVARHFLEAAAACVPG